MAIEANIIQIEFWQLMKVAGGIILSLSGSAWFLVRIIVRQFTNQLQTRFHNLEQVRIQRDKNLDLRFEALEKLIKDNGNDVKQLERDLLELKAELPIKFVLREDDIRKEAVMHNKLDALAEKIDSMNGRQ